MSEPAVLRIDGEVARPGDFSREDLARLAADYQVPDVTRLDPKRPGKAVTLAGLLSLVEPRATAQYVTLHSAADDFHASIPLAAVRERGIVLYELADAALPVKSGGPFRFLIPDYAACHTAEIDECANVKFVDHIELTATRGRDNRPADEGAHAELHRRDDQH